MQHAIAEQPEPAQPVAPLVKWVGGKGAMVPTILRALPATFGAYYEPFAGGAAVAFALEAHRGPHELFLGDLNRDLIHAYRTVAASPDAVIRRLQWMARKHNPTYYLYVRERWNAGPPAALFRRGEVDVKRAAAFLYLNRTCFNGLWRVNRRGGFNVPMGAYKNPAICDPDRLRAAAGVLNRAALVSGPWQRTIASVRPGDVVFFDPPYVPRSGTSDFTMYQRAGFGDAQQVELAAAAALLVDAGVHVIATNSDCRRVRELYAGPRWKRQRVMMTRSISSKGTGRGAVAELLLVGGPRAG